MAIYSIECTRIRIKVWSHLLNIPKGGMIVERKALAEKVMKCVTEEEVLELLK